MYTYCVKCGKWIDTNDWCLPIKIQKTPNSWFEDSGKYYCNDNACSLHSKYKFKLYKAKELEAFNKLGIKQ